MSPVHHFNTSPPVGSEDKFTALVYGDMGVSPVPRAYKTAEYATKEALSGNASFVFHNGDISYARGYVSEFNWVFLSPKVVIPGKLIILFCCCCSYCYYYHHCYYYYYY